MKSKQTRENYVQARNQNANHHDTAGIGVSGSDFATDGMRGAVQPVRGAMLRQPCHS